MLCVCKVLVLTPYSLVSRETVVWLSVIEFVAALTFTLYEEVDEMLVVTPYSSVLWMPYGVLRTRSR
jgi:hypothetical protein